MSFKPAPILRNPPRYAILTSVLIGALPWILAAVIATLGFPRAAVVARFTLALVPTLRGLRAKNIKALDLTTFLYAVTEVALTFGFGLWWILRYGGVTSQGAMALMAILSVAVGSPFTYQYAREAWPRDYWDNPIFRRTNAILSLGFAGSFTLGALANAAALALPGLHDAVRVTLGSIVPPFLGIGMGVASAWISKAYPRYALARVLRERAPHRWIVPQLPASPAKGDADVVVIGAGIGGLTSAALLARRGLRVVVLEQHTRPGGCCSSWARRTKVGDFIFDAGVHDISGLGPRGPVRHLLSELGALDKVDWLRVTQRLDLDGLTLDIPEDAHEFASLLGRHFPEKAASIHRVFAELEAVYREMYADVDRQGGVPCEPKTVDEMLEFPRTHPAMRRWMDTPFTAFVRSFGCDGDLERILRSLSSYLTDDPSRLRVLDMAPLFGYHFDGGFYPKGSSQALTDLLVATIKEAGGSVRLRTPVRRIVVEGGHAVGVETSKGVVIRAPIIVSNADVRRTFSELITPEAIPLEARARILSARPGPSAAACFLGLDFVPKVPAFIRSTHDGKRVGIAIPSLLDPSLAPRNHSAVTLLSLIPSAEAGPFDRGSPGYTERKRALGDELIRRAEHTLGDLRGHIVFREDATPATFERYLWSSKGSIYGLDRDYLERTAKSALPGLFLVGGGVRPGSGIEGVVISGTRAANEICPAR